MTSTASSTNSTNSASTRSATELHESSIVIDGLTFYYDGPSERLNPQRVTATNVTACETYSGFAAALQEIADVRKAVQDDPNATLILSGADIERAKRDRLVGIILGLQASLPIETDLTRVHLLRDLGVRIIQLTYNDRTYAGDGCLEPVDGGLSRFGRQLVNELAQAGVVLDLSHVGRRTSLEAIDASPKPPIFSHANPAALTASPRNLTDEQIKKVGERGGLVGVCCWAPLCWKNRAGQRPTVDDFIDHVDYVVNLIGPNHVSIATDSACTTNDAWIKQHSAEFNAAFPEIAGEYLAQVGEQKHPEGLPGVANLVPVTEALLRRGYAEDNTQKIIGGNFLRLTKQIWGS